MRTQEEKIAYIKGAFLACGSVNDPSTGEYHLEYTSPQKNNGQFISKILKEINKEGKLVIVVTHSNKVIDYSTRVITIDDGKIKSDKKIKKVKERN